MGDRDEHTVAKGYPKRQGLYDSRNEHDACGIGFVANIKGKKSHDIVEKGLQILENLTHRGAVGADPKAGDGAGILIQTPDEFFQAECSALGFDLPDFGDYAVGVVFMSQDKTIRRECEKVLEKYVVAEGQTLIGWRDVPVDNNQLGETVKITEPKDHYN